MNGSDQDSDSLYVTNQKEIVSHAAMCYKVYPTIVNNIPKDTNKYNNTMHDFAAMDNALAGSQRDIGESSNLAQICLTYSFNFDDPKYNDYVAVLSVIAQASIDSAKRRFDIDIASEIRRIRDDMDIKKYKHPRFWRTIRKGFEKERINPSLHCPMNYLQDLKVGHAKHFMDQIDLCDLLIKEKVAINRNASRKIEKLIEDYSIDYYNYATNELYSNGEYDYNNFILLRSNFDNLINDIRSSSMSNKYRQLVLWLIKRAFSTEPYLVNNKKKMLNRTNKNKSVLFKVLYDVNPELFLSCFIKNN